MTKNRDMIEVGLGSIIAIHKPVGPSSNAILTRIKRITGIKKVGHAGTLDPLASGVLVVGIGRSATKLLWGSDLDEKEYVASIQFGVTSTTDDEEGEKTQIAAAKIPSPSDIKNVLKKFVGTIQQTPPIYSALKIAGKPAYKLARAGTPIALASRSVIIDNIELLEYEWPVTKIRVRCHSGVYIRSLCRYVGELLGCGAYTADLMRTRVGKFSLDECLALEQFETLWNKTAPSASP